MNRNNGDIRPKGIAIKTNKGEGKWDKRDKKTKCYE